MVIDGAPKLATSEPMSRFQPSTSTNSMSLNGSEISTGDSIIMPIDISTLATTMSMIRNGMKIMKPIWNAVFSSLVTKAGMSTRSGTSSAALSARLAARACVNSARSGSRVWLQHERRERHLARDRAPRSKPMLLLAVRHVGVVVDAVQRPGP